MSPITPTTRREGEGKEAMIGEGVWKNVGLTCYTLILSAISSLLLTAKSYFLRRTSGVTSRGLIAATAAMVGFADAVASVIATKYADSAVAAATSLVFRRGRAILIQHIRLDVRDKKKDRERSWTKVREVKALIAH